MALTTPDDRSTRRWRSRAFVQPLLITIVGVVVSIVLYVNAAGNDAITIFTTIPVLLVGVLITGIIVGIIHASGPAFRAVVAGVMVPVLIWTALALLNTFAGPFFGDYVMTTVGGLGTAVGLGFVLLIPAALGFGVGRLVRRIFRQ